MKALKEKRVSLRSLFRRSLVILSLLALAFASCSDSGGSDTPTSQPPTNGPTQTAPVKTVVRLNVIDHPYLPSYEGAYPDLTGLKVQVLWNNNGVEEYEYFEGEDALANFMVTPSVALVETPGNSVNKFSTFNLYQIRYKGDAYYDAKGPAANVYIPAVVAITDYTKAAIAGSIGDIFEDQDFDTKDLELFAIYDDDVSLTDLVGKEPLNYQSPYWITGTGPVDWPTGLSTDSNTIGHRISIQRDAWRVSQNPDSMTVEYLIRSVDNTDIKAVTVKTGKYYRVANIELTGGADKIKGVAVDDPSFNEDPDPRNVAGYPNFTTNTGNAPSNGYRVKPSVAIGQSWLWKLKEAALTFKVTYYDPKAHTNNSGPTRNITIDDYIRAAYDSDKNGVAKASLPIPIGRVQTPTGTPSGSKWLVSDVITSVSEDYPLSLALFYYNVKLEGREGEGYVDMKHISDNEEEYVHANYAVVPITANNVIYTYSGLRALRKDDTYFENDDIPARVPSNMKDETASKNAFDELQRFYKVVYEYTNDARGGDPIQVTAPWRDWASYGYPHGNENTSTFEGFDNEPNEGSEDEARECSVFFDLPVSMQLEGENVDAPPFPFRMKPF